MAELTVDGSSDPTSDPASPAPSLSVLIAGWNAASTVERAVASVLDEHDISLECVVVDDGSTDGMADVVRGMAIRDPRVVLVPLATNGGVSHARNRGLEVVRGTWLTFLDADDRLLPGGVAALMRPTSDPDVRAVVAQRIWTDGERTWLGSSYDNPDVREPGRKSIATHPGLLYYASMTGKLFHRSLIGGLRFEGRVLGDQPWTIRALLRADDRIEVIADTVYEWTRPRRDDTVQTITSAKKASAERAAEMVTVARSAFAEVSAEVDAQVSDKATRRDIKRAYLDRLFRSDFGEPLRTAIGRRDPAIGQMYVAVAEFLEAVPPQILAGSRYLVTRILLPPAERWWGLPRAARSAYWRMVAAALRADPRLWARREAGPLRPALMLARSFEGRGGTAAGSVALWVVSLGRSVIRRLTPS